MTLMKKDASSLSELGFDVHTGAGFFRQDPSSGQDGELTRRAVVGGAREVIGLMGYTSWAIGYSVASLARSLLRDQRRVYPVSVLAKGFVPGDAHEVFLSLPDRLGCRGVLGVAAELELISDEETTRRRSAETLWGYCQVLELLLTVHATGDCE